MRLKPSLRRLMAIISRPSFWLLILLFLLVTLLQSTELLKYQIVLGNLGITRYTIERILYLFPLFYAAFLFGWKGGALASLVALAFMLSAAIWSSPNREDALIESVTVFIIGNLMSVSLSSLRKERQRRAQLEVAEKELQFLLQQVTGAQEEERKRIARELHDDTIQSLVVLCQQIDNLSSSVKGMPRQAKARLDDLYQKANTIMQEVRRLSQDLRPATLDNLGLVAALEWLASGMTNHSGISCDLKVIGAARRFSNDVELVLFRIAQEALMNVNKHANAGSAQITLEFAEGKTRLTVTDNGQGFIAPPDFNALPKEGKLGLIGMQERTRLLKGALSVKSGYGKGTNISVELPF